MITFVILHYNNLSDTKECIASIKKLKGRKKIIVVDNHTLNEEESKNLEKEVNDLLLLEENLGFAKANNQGILLAKEKYDAKFVVVINNDIVINQENFIDIIKEDYKKYQFDMLGGKIISPGDSCNPFPALESREVVLKEITYTRKLIKIYENDLLTSLLKMYITLKHVIKKPVKMTNGKYLQEQVPLHGCALIFSKKYLEKYKEPFYKETFLYHEEDFLYERIKKDNLISVYDPNLEVYHKEGASLKATLKSKREKKLFREQERLKSLILLEKYMREGE